MSSLGAEICAPHGLRYSGAITGLLSLALAPNSALQGSKSRNNLLAASELERDAS